MQTNWVKFLDEIKKQLNCVPGQEISTRTVAQVAWIMAEENVALLVATAKAHDVDLIYGE